MDFFSNVSVFSKTSTDRKKADAIVEKLPSNTEIASDVFNMIENTTTKMVLEESTKASYYVFLTDTIYLSNNAEVKNRYTRLCTLCHEMIHSIQPKWLQKLNFAFSNFELLSFIVILILFFLKIAVPYLLGIYIVILILSSIPRIVLETEAILKSVLLSKKYLDSVKEISLEDKQYLLNIYSFQTKFLFPIFMIQLFFGKLVRCLLIYLLIAYF